MARFSSLVSMILPHQDVLFTLKSSFIDLFLSSCSHILPLHPRTSALYYEFLPCKEIHFFKLLDLIIYLSDESQNTVYSWKTKVMFISLSSHFLSSLLLLILLPWCLCICANALQWLILSSNYSIKEYAVSGKNMNFRIIEIWVLILKTDHPQSWAFKHIWPFFFSFIK